MRTTIYMKIFRQIFGILFLFGVYFDANSQMRINPESSNLAPKELTKKAAEMVCQSSYGNYPLYDEVTYFDTDKERSCDIYIFAKNDKWSNKKSILLDSIYLYRQLFLTYSDSIKNVYNYITNPKSIEKRIEIWRRYVREFSELSCRPMDFVTIYTSASKNHMPIFEYREGLPESYVLPFDIEKIAQEKQIDISNGVDYYYFGIVRSYFAPNGTDNRHFINLCNPEIKLSENQVENYKYNIAPIDIQFLDKKNEQWEFLEYTQENIGKNENCKSPLSSHTIPDVPYFNQNDWLNVFPASNSCAVMSSASVLSYYDSFGYWNITPQAWYVGPGFYYSGGFDNSPGTNFVALYPTIWGGQREISFGPETMLYDLAVKLGYNFEIGGTYYNCVQGHMYPKLIAYTNTQLGLNFSYSESICYLPATYDEIKTEVDNNRPMILGNIFYWSWDSSPGPYDDNWGSHDVAIVAYDEGLPNYAGKAIGVYLNAQSGQYEPIWWNYDNILASNSYLVTQLFTLKCQAGGNPGTDLNSPDLLIPINNSTISGGNISFVWQDVNALDYRIQVSTNTTFNLNSLIFDGNTNNTYLTVSIVNSGQYYWRILPKNSNDHWCHFQDSPNSFIVSGPNISLSTSSISFGNVPVYTNSIPQSYTVSGTNLLGDILINAPFGFEISEYSSQNFSPSITLTSNGGIVPLTTIYARFNPISATYYSGEISHSTSGSAVQNINVTGIGVIPTITTSFVSLNFQDITVGTCSSVLQYTVFGNNLIENIVVTAPAGFQVSLNPTSGFTSIIPLVQTDGTVPPTTIYARFCPTSPEYYQGNITHTSSGAETKNVPVNGNGVNSSITLSTSSLAFGNVTVGTYSAAQQYMVTGNNLTADIVITAPAGFQVSASSTTGFGSTLTLTQSGGSVPATPVYARFGPITTGSYSDNIIHSSTGAATQNLAVTGTGNAQPGITVSTTILPPFSNVVLYTCSAPQSYNVSGTNLTANLYVTAPWCYQVSLNSTSGFVSEVILIPSGGTVPVTPIYVRFCPLTTGPLEGIVLNSSVGSNSQFVAVSGNCILQPTITFVPTSISFGPVQIGTNSPPQQYMVSAYGLTSNLTITAPTAFQISINVSSGYGSTVVLIPTNGYLTDVPIYARFCPTTVMPYNGNITHSATGAVTQNLAVSGTGVNNPSPTITVSTTSLTNFGNVPVGTNSSSQQYTVSGSNLTSNITLQAPTGFQISLSSGSGYTSLLTLTQSGGNVVTTPIYARFSPLNIGVYSDSIVHTSPDAAIKKVGVTGTGIQPPPITYTLTIAAQNPQDGVNISVSPPDNSGHADGITQFTRVYNTGTSIMLTAPVSAGGNSFLKWLKNGVEFCYNSSNPILCQSINFTLAANDTYKAIYQSAASTKTLTVASQNPSSGVNVVVSPLDNMGLTNGITLFTRVYNNGSNITLTAPSVANSNIFQKWNKNGSLYSQVPSASFTLNASDTYMAVYQSPAGLAPVTTLSKIEAVPGTTINVPINVDNFNNITGLTLRIEYDPTILNFQNYTNVNSNLVAGIYVNDVHMSPTLHKILIIWSDVPLSLSSGSKILDLVFTYISGTTAMTFNNTSNGGMDCEFTDAVGNPLPDTPSDVYYINGDVHPNVYTINGLFIYNNTTKTVLDSVWVCLYQNGIIIDSVRTNITGQYSFSNKSSGVYTVEGKTKKTWAGVNSTDAVKIQRHFSGLEPLIEPIRINAGDVNLSNSINATDALKVKRRFAGLDTAFTRGDWTFAKPIIGGDSIVIDGANVTQNFYGLCVGDVNGSNTPGPGAKVSSSAEMLSSGIVFSGPNQEFDLPIVLDQNMNLSAVSLILNYPSDLLEIIKIIIKSGDPIYRINNGELRLAWSELESIQIQPGDPLFILKVRTTNKFTSGKIINFSMNPLSELANEEAEVIYGANLKIATIQSSGTIGNYYDQKYPTEVQVYPNPANQLVYIEYKLLFRAEVTIKITTIYGQNLAVKNFRHETPGEYKQMIDIAEFPDGIYCFEVFINYEKSSVTRVVKLVINK
jgi:hypothetical protein